ncbi:DUF6165 family protein [Methylocystis heyeri]|uniref:Tetratricopeptide repeat protein n=1 Tax=Methylocystis heyeri TaxID=391905 RepID=A0A6B8KBL1_9HYPH|nr:DUF6165 family protein [Methylocystis heyeri]QGM45119.1 tetratricopeptide repeat protein [Methylocystis heyeri]
MNDPLARGLAFHRRGELFRAEQIYCEIVTRDAANVVALHLLGVVMTQTGRAAKGVAFIDRALAIHPNDAEALYNRGNALLSLRRFEEALESFDKALAIAPRYAEAHNNRGNVLQELNRHRDALPSYDKALAITPHYAEAHNNRANALKELRRLGEALESYDKALVMAPRFVKALYNRGAALQELGHFGEALASYDQALALKPDHADARYNRALLALLQSDFVAGWQDYESRWDRKGAPKRKLTASFPSWKGENIAGKKIVIYDEQGFGDVIQFSRYVTKLVEAGAHVTFLVRASLLRLMESLPSRESIRLVTSLPPAESFDFQCPLLSLPLAFQTRLESPSTATPYLRAEQQRALKWREKIGEDGFKVGIAWQGSKAGKIDLGRSFALAELHGLSRIQNLRLVSLQKNDGVEQLSRLPDGMIVESLGDDYDAGEDAFLDAAAVMESLDLVVTSDTSIAHLAGALGRPVWVALQRTPDWRWLLERSDSPWYPSIRLFRQRTSGDWKGVFTDIETAVRELMNEWRPRPRAEPPRAPISWGELIDKITILEIKSAEIMETAARANVERELRMLQEVVGPRDSREAIASLKSELKATNLALWSIENSIREKERAGEFDPEFVELARSVYKRNDERARLKRQISTALGSEIIEEKCYGAPA